VVCAGLLLVAAATGCKSEKKDDGKATTKPTTKEPVDKGSGSMAQGSGSASGTGAASGSGSATPTPPPTPTTGEMTAEEMAARYGECWGFFNDRKWDDFKGCFEPDAESKDVDQPEKKGVEHIVKSGQDFVTAFPDGKAEIQLTLVGDKHVVGVILITGTHEGPIGEGPQAIPATHKKIGLLIGDVMDFHRKTRLVSGEWSFADPLTMLGQIGAINAPHREPMTASLPEKGSVVLEGGTDVEKANLAALQASTEAFNKHDLEAVAASRTDDMTFYDSSTPNDVDKKQMMMGIEALVKAFSDLKSNVGGAFAAGDYVASFGELTGTNDGSLDGKSKPTGKAIKTGFLTIGHYKDGKIDKAWRFVNGLSLLGQLGLMK
jgi:predicted ester cyclase